MPRNRRDLQKSELRGTTFIERAREQLRASHLAAPGPASGTALLLDLSGSMWGSAGTGRTKLEELEQVVHSLPPVRRFGFSTLCRQLSADILTEAHRDFGHNTDLAEAFGVLRAAGHTSIALVTDGLPDDAAGALRATQGLTVHIFYVGPEPVPQFLRDLASKTGGQFGAFALGSPALTTSIQGLLASPTRQGATKP